MKRLLLVSVAALTILAAGAAAFAGDKDPNEKTRPRIRQQMRQRMADANCPWSDANAPWKDPNSPWAQRRAKMQEKAEQAHQKRIERLKEIRQIAVDEKATKTVEAIDKLIADVEKNFQKRQARAAERPWMPPGPGRMGRRHGGMRPGGPPMGPPPEPPPE